MSQEIQLHRLLLHEGQRSKLVRNYQRLAKQVVSSQREQFPQLVDRLMEFVANDRFLWSSYQHIRQHGGPAPGNDGIVAGDLATCEVWDMLRDLARDILAGTYQPGPPRRVPIPKLSGNAKKRTISVLNLRDRIAAGAAAFVLRPLLTSHSDSLSYCRAGRGTPMALAMATRFIENDRRHQLIAEDLRDAYDHVPQQRLTKLLRKHVPNNDFCNLVGALAYGPGRHGILQGSALSSQLLNLYLDETLHKPWRRRHPDVPLLRYADDLLIACRSDEAADGLYNDLAELVVSAGFQLKHGADHAISDVRTQSVTWLGYVLQHHPQGLVVKSNKLGGDTPVLAQRQRRELVEKFGRVHEKPHGWRDVMAVAAGILAHAMPTFPFVDRPAVCRQIVDAAAEAGCDLDGGVLLDDWSRRHAYWISHQIPMDADGNPVAVADLSSREVDDSQRPPFNWDNLAPDSVSGVQR